MHFLSHYHIDRHLQDPYFVLGALLPDIAPHFTKTYNEKIRKGELVYAGQSASIHAGVLRHYQVDGVFHAIDDFRDLCRRMGAAMIGQGLDREYFRIWFLSHIAAEVMIDKLLVAKDKALVDEYYGMLSSVDINKLDVYLKTLVSSEDSTKILANFGRFAEIKFLYNLHQTESAAEGIMRTAHKATGVVFGNGDRQKLLAALDNIENEIRYSSEILLDPRIYAR
jgi:hypothetical protein